MPYYQYQIQVPEQVKKEIAIALLSELGILGFEEKEAELLAVTSEEIPPEKLNVVMQITNATYTLSIIEDKNWNEKWEAGFQPIVVTVPGSTEIFAYVRAHFHPPLPGVQHDLIITPKMSFGTGHHATTYGMMAFMSRMNFKGLSVVDFGTGTGVLAILAEKLGAGKILALDNDPWCIRNAGENALVNKSERVELRETDQFESMEKPDVILANINLNIIKNNLKLITHVSHSETVFLFSGILEKDETQIITALQNFNIGAIDIIKNGGWLIIAAKKRNIN